MIWAERTISEKRKPLRAPSCCRCCPLKRLSVVGLAEPLSSVTLSNKLPIAKPANAPRTPPLIAPIHAPIHFPYAMYVCLLICPSSLLHPVTYTTQQSAIVAGRGIIIVLVHTYRCICLLLWHEHSQEMMQ